MPSRIQDRVQVPVQTLARVPTILINPRVTEAIHSLSTCVPSPNHPQGRGDYTSLFKSREPYTSSGEKFDTSGLVSKLFKTKYNFAKTKILLTPLSHCDDFKTSEVKKNDTFFIDFLFSHIKTK